MEKQLSDLAELADFDTIQEKISESSRQIAKINNALGIGKVVVLGDGIYRIFDDGSRILIVSGDFSEKKVESRKVKIF
jgi:hypothetical protein